MKWLLFFLFLLMGYNSIAQPTDDSTKYVWYKYQYGTRMPRSWWDSIAHLPYFDTTGIRPARPGALMMHLDKKMYKWDSTNWVTSEGTPTILANIGSGFRWVATSTGNIKTVANSNTIIWDSTSNANSLTAKVDTSVLATQSDLLNISGINPTLTAGDTALRQIIWKDTTVSGSSGTMTINTVVPSNYGVVYTNGEGGLFNQTLARFNGVNPDGRPNVVYNILGYNITAGGGRINTNEASFRFGAETHFQLDVAQNPAFEFHLPEITTFTGSTYRPFSLYVRKNSGFTNANMQVDQLNLARRSNGVNWASHAYDSNVTVNYTPDDNGKRVAINANLPSFIGTMVYDSTGWSISSNVTNSTKQFSTNLPIRYGASSNRSGIDGYGDVTFREGKITMFNTGTNTTFADWQFGGSQKFNFTKDNAVFSVSLLTVGSANIVPVGGSKILSANGEALLISSSGGAGSDIRFLNGVDNARQVTIFQASSGAGNVNIGASTTNPAHKLKVQGSVVVDSNLFVAMHTISSDVDSAVVWDRTTNVYKVGRITGRDSGIWKNNVTMDNSYTMTQGTNNWTATGSNASFSLKAINTSSGNGLIGQSSSGGGVYGVSTSGTGLIGESSSGEAGSLYIIPSSTATLDPVMRVTRFSSGTAANGAGGSFDYYTQSSNGSAQRSNRIGSIWSNATTATRTSRLEFYGVNIGTEARKAALSGTGQWIWDGYGSGTFTGSLSSYLVSTSGGDIIEQPASAVPLISTGTAAPATTPGKVGDMYIDTVNKKLYFATGTSSSADWTIAN